VIEVVRPGALALVQDLGRPRFAHLGVPPSGALDPAALRLANRLVGNPEGAAAIELTLGGARLRFSCEAVVALAGADVAASAGGRGLAMRARERICAGLELRLGTATGGIRTYLAVRGGIDATAALGSRASDQLTGLGPQPLRGGDRLQIGTRAFALPTVDFAPVPAPPSDVVLRVVPGPRADWFTPRALDALLGGPYIVSPESSRIGLRLEGPSLPYAREDELLSEGMVTGSLQVPPSGQPILLLNDHPTTGGYPVIAVVVSDDLGLAGQLAPGREVGFERVVPPARRCPRPGNTSRP
jgi:biotin-dependent carboxylase-like uncharacterized protein